MAPIQRCLASVAGLSLSRPSAMSIPRFLAPALVQSRQASVDKKNKKAKAKAKRVVPKDYQRHNLEKREFPRFSLCEAMRVLRAAEVGQPPASTKYEVHINLKAIRNGPVIKSSVRLPHPAQSDWRIAVICPEGSRIAMAATAAGAVAVGEDTIFDAVRKEDFNFDRLICHESSEQALNKAGLGKILGPKGLMPNARMRTIVKDVAKSIQDSAGAAEYRERQGVIRLAIGQLSHTQDQLKANLGVLIKKIKAECVDISKESLPKEVHEVILSSTHGPALSLDGKLSNEWDEVPPEALTSAM